MFTLRKLCKVDEMKNGELREFMVKEKAIVVVNDNGTFMAIGGICPHFSAPMSLGTYANGKLRCPYHGACFDMKTGDIEDYPGLDCLPAFETKISDGHVYLLGDKTQFEVLKRIKHMYPPQALVQRAPIVIVGGGPSAQICAEVMRQEGYRGGILMLSAEKYLPYDRVLLTKMQNASPESICYRDAAFYRKHHIDIRLNSIVTTIDSEDKKIKLENGQTFDYSKLVVAVGGHPRKLALAAHDLKGIHYIRQLDDNTRVHVKDKKVVVIGASFIGLESAALWSKDAESVTVIGNDTVPLNRTMGPFIGNAVLKLFQQNNVEILTKCSVESVEGFKGVLSRVVLNTGRCLEADVIIAGIGMIPSTEFLRNGCIELDKRGFIPVNESFETNVADVYAMGDCCAFPLPYFSGLANPVNIQHYQMAQMHGQTVGKILAGRKVKMLTTPFFWSLFFGVPVRFAGYATDLSDYVLKGDVDSDHFNIYYFRVTNAKLSNLEFWSFRSRNDRVVGVASYGVNNSQSVPFLALFNQRKEITRREVEENDTDTWNHLF